MGDSGDNEPGGLAPNVQMLFGALAALAGYLLPWFDASRSDWWYSGWQYANASGGWTLFIVACLLLAVGDRLPDRRTRYLAIIFGFLGFFCSGWTRFPISCLLVAINGSLRAGRSLPAAKIAVTAGISGMFFALSMVAASIGSMGSIDSVAEMRMGVGLPLMAGGFGLLLTGALRFRHPTAS
jgi:hypothetical protein